MIALWGQKVKFLKWPQFYDDNNQAISNIQLQNAFFGNLQLFEMHFCWKKVFEVAICYMISFLISSFLWRNSNEEDIWFAISDTSCSKDNWYSITAYDRLVYLFCKMNLKYSRTSQYLGFLICSMFPIQLSLLIPG